MLVVTQDELVDIANSVLQEIEQPKLGIKALPAAEARLKEILKSDLSRSDKEKVLARYAILFGECVSSDLPNSILFIYDDSDREELTLALNLSDEYIDPIKVMKYFSYDPDNFSFTALAYHILVECNGKEYEEFTSEYGWGDDEDDAEVEAFQEVEEVVS